MNSAIGILGGAFDPPHNGHLALAREAVEHFQLERLLVRVVADPGHKDVDTAADVRLRLAELAFASIEVAEVSLDPFGRTVDSLEALGLADPLFLLGADELAAFPTWVRPDRVLELARIGAATRPGTDLAGLERVVASLSRPERVELFPITPLAVSSSEIRERVAPGCRSTISCRRRRRRDRAARPLSRRLNASSGRRTLHFCPTWKGCSTDPTRPRKLTDLTSLEQARRIAALCEEKLATDVTILDMRTVCDYTDFFVIASGSNTRQVKAISDEVHFVMKRDHGLLPRAVAGEREATWIVADYIDAVLHVFTDETREFYRLEDLWNDVPKLEAAASA